MPYIKTFDNKLYETASAEGDRLASNNKCTASNYAKKEFKE